jgi:excisionase family DNA binding protein
MEAILKPLEAGAIDYIGELRPVVEFPPRKVRSMSTGGRISVNDIAARLSIGRATVYAMLEKRIIPAIRLGRKWLVTRRAFEAWEQTCGKEAIVASGDYKLAA